MTTNDQGYTYQPPRRIAYDLGILMAGGALLTVVLGVAVYLIALTFAASPVVSALCVVLVVIMCALFSASIIRQSREHAAQLADVHKAVAAGAAAAITAALNQIIRQAQPQIPPAFVQRAELPAPVEVFDVRRSIVDNRPAGAGRVSAPGPVDGTVVECSTAGLTAALEILAAGGQPTRSAFRERGVPSSIEHAAAIDVLESLGYAERGAGQGSATRWAPGVTAESAGDIHAHLRTFVPTLPEPPEPVRNLPAGRASGQAGRQAGSRKGRLA